jgi:hypothetical protein
MRIGVKWSAWIGLSLLLWTLAAESTHKHPSLNEGVRCAVCLAAHTANPAPHSANTTPAFAALGVLHEEAVLVNFPIEFSDLDIRSPPVWEENSCPL